jgi:ubiquinone/menaquinone biosynthesis C-methylase UbiE
MADKFTRDEIRAYWTKQAVSHRQSPSASWSDHMAIELEIKEVLQHLRHGDRVLDAGCGNGYSTVRFASERQLEIKGVDYIPEMIEQAQARRSALLGPTRSALKFEVGNIMALTDPDQTFDKVIAIRVLINLGGEDGQGQALRQCARVLKTGGVLLVSEATVQGWRRLNQFRAEWGLPEIPMPPFNQYVDEERLVEIAKPVLEVVQIRDFSSTYFVGTRVLKPLLIRAFRAEIDVANPDMEWNRWFAQLPAFGDYGTQRLFVFRKS